MTVVGIAGAMHGTQGLNGPPANEMPAVNRHAPRIAPGPVRQNEIFLISRRQSTWRLGEGLPLLPHQLAVVPVVTRGTHRIARRQRLRLQVHPRLSIDCIDHPAGGQHRVIVSRNGQRRLEPHRYKQVIGVSTHSQVIRRDTQRDGDPGSLSRSPRQGDGLGVTQK